MWGWSGEGCLDRKSSSFVALDGCWSGNVPFVLRLWIIYFPHSDSKDSHHEQNRSAQQTFLWNVNSLIETLEDIGNPFTESSDDSLALDTKNNADSCVFQIVRQIESKKKKIFMQFFQGRHIKREKESIKRIPSISAIAFLRSPWPWPQRSGTGARIVLNKSLNLQVSS